MVDEARQQIDLFRIQANDNARKQVQRRWEDATVALTEVDLELAGLRSRRQIVLAKLAQLEESIEESRAQLRERGEAEPVDSSASGPEHHPWASIPIEW
jgi:DNA repair exonuclease SbcCD ATPase subunit